MVHDEKEIKKKTESFIDDTYELMYFRWTNIFWASMFIGHQCEPNSILYWILAIIGGTATTISFYYLYKWFRQ